MTTVIVGNGMAAVRLVEELVARGIGDITVLGEEAHAPYNRILLSAVLEGTHRAESITLRTPEWYAANGVDLRLGVHVSDIHRDVREVELRDGTRLPYDRVVLATGSIAVLPPIRGLVRLDGKLNDRVHAFRSLADCNRLLAMLPEAKSALVVGGGLLGLQVARALSVQGLRTEVIEGADHLLRSHVDEAAGKVLERSLTKLGTAVYTGARAVRFMDSADGCGIKLDNGYVFDADLVVITAGGRPSIRLAYRAGLEVEWGIVVDDQLTTSDPAIFAIGDCAEHGRRPTGLVPPAWEQASVLAAHLAGEPAAYVGHRVVARLRATDLDVAVLGDPERAVGDIVQSSNPIAGSHKKLVVKDGVIVAATLVGDLSRVGLITQAFDRRTRLAPGEPGALLMPERRSAPVALPDEAEVCACAGVSAGRIRACSDLAEVRETTRATTGCGGCTAIVETLIPQLVKGRTA